MFFVDARAALHKPLAVRCCWPCSSHWPVPRVDVSARAVVVVVFIHSFVLPMIVVVVVVAGVTSLQSLELQQQQQQKQQPWLRLLRECPARKGEDLISN